MGDVCTLPRGGLRPLDTGLEDAVARVATGAIQRDGQPVLVLAVTRLLDQQILGAGGPRRSIAVKAPAPESAAGPTEPPPASVKGPLIDRLGGMAAVERAIRDLLLRTADDPELAPLVAAADRDGLDAALCSLAGMLFGAPVFYAGPPLQQVAELGMDRRRFDAALGHLAGALRATGAAGPDVADAVAAAEMLRPAVVRG